MLNLLFILALAIMAFIIVVSRRPDTFRVSRSAVISASPDKLFPHINNLRNWKAWSPWARMDPNSTATFEGTDEGVGMKLSWEGKKTGQGNMTIIESRPNELVKLNMVFVKPFKANNTAEFTFEPQGDKTKLTWTTYGHNNFMGKMFSMFVDCDKMTGDQFEKGLRNIEEIM